MADMPNEFWSGWIIILTVLSLVALAWLVLSVYFMPPQEREKGPEYVWDEDLREGSNPAPLWWFWLMLAAMVFSVIYLMLYPGLGSFQGALRWSQGGQVSESYTDYREEFESVRQEIAGMSPEALRMDPAMMETAGNIFGRHCAACHGEAARGQANLFPDLRDDDWQWGGSPDRIEQTIRDGRRGIMAPWQEALGGEGLEQVTDYVLELGGEAAGEHPGRMPFNQFCAACHGTDGTGNPMLGAPDLTDGTWLYGGSRRVIRETIAMGRTGIMPAFGQLLDDTQITLLVAWLTRPPVSP